MLVRIQTTLASPNPVKRIAHYVFGGILFHTPTTIRKLLFGGGDYYCPICKNSLKKFLPLYRPYHAWCPICKSLERHRLVWFFFQRDSDIFNHSPKKMLHIAPEDALSHRFKLINNLNYISIDLNDRSAMLKMDITNLQFPDDNFDVIFCSHVLEHVDDDKKAIRELWRVSKPNGCVIIMVPITAILTIEDPSITDPVDRERLFGKHDHVRRYGPDIYRRLKACGFNVNVINVDELVNDQEIIKMGLLKQESIFSCIK